MRKFLTKHMKSGLKITFEYSYNGIVKSFEFEGEWKKDSIEKVLPMIPLELEKMLSEIQVQKPGGNWFFTEITEVSFKAFCAKYPRKDGGIAIAEKAWNKLSEADQLDAILYIPVLIKEKNDGTAFPYRATYLNQKRWR